MIVLTLPYPISANRYWATRVIKAKATGRWMAMTYVTPEAREYREQAAWIARAAGVHQPFDSRVKVHILLYPQRPQDYRTRMRKLGAQWDDGVQCIDLGNCEKVLSDALQGVVFSDDRWIWDLRKQRMEPDERGARLIMKIEPIVVAQPQQELVA